MLFFVFRFTFFEIDLFWIILERKMSSMLLEGSNWTPFLSAVLIVAITNEYFFGLLPSTSSRQSSFLETF